MLDLLIDLIVKHTRGWVGEKKVTLGLWLTLDSEVYRRIDDLVVPARNGTTQIDHVLVSPYGIFVVETKNYKGWIFGSPDDDSWTQALTGRKSRFQNPLKQNYRHTRCLAEYLSIDHSIFHSVVFFIGDCEFKTEVPPNVMTDGLVPYIQSFQKELLSWEQVNQTYGRLKDLKVNPVASKGEHLDSLRQRHESTTQCPKCGAKLVQRRAKTGAYAGKPFLGCAAYPKCRFIRQVDG